MGCLGFAACVFVFLNIPLGLIGVVLAAVGVVLQLSDSVLKPYIDPLLAQLPSQAQGYTTEISTYIQPAAIAFIVIGCIFSVVAILGCLGLCFMKNGAGVCFFAIYAIFAGLFLLIFIGLTVLIASPQRFVGDQLRKEMNSSLVTKYIAVDSTDTVNVAWNIAQMGLQCCGVNSGIDFEYAVKFNRTWITVFDPTTGGNAKMKIPPTCCTDELISLSSMTGGSDSEAMKNPAAMAPCVYETSPKFSNYAKGCYEAVFNKYYQFQWHILGPAIAICIILLFLFICPIVFACKANHHKEERHLEQIEKANQQGDTRFNDYNNYK